MRFVGIGLLALLAASCGGLRFPDGPQPGGFRTSEIVDAVPYGAFQALDGPRQEPSATVDPAGTEPLAVVTVGGEVRAYPLSILIWHQVVNDTVGGLPVAITYGPYGDAPAAWDRRDGVRPLTFEPSGKIHAGSLLLTDRETRSLWLQPAGRAVAGPGKGRRLGAVALVVMPAAAYRAAEPNGTLMSPETGHARPYGRTPYPGYEAATTPPRRLFLRPGDRRLPAMSRVLAVPGGKAYPFDVVRERSPIVDGDTVVIWIPGTASMLDAEIVAGARDAGSAVAYRRTVAGRTLTFTPVPSGLKDEQTGSRWDLLGRAVAGPLEGERLTRRPGIRSLWFAWAALDPGIQVYAPAQQG